MVMNRAGLLILVLSLVLVPAPAAPSPGKKSDKEALQAFQRLIGDWRGNGTPLVGTREERDKGFWQENVGWQWKFKDKDVWLQADIAKGKWYTKLELRYVAAKDHFQLKATKDKETFTFEGKLAQKRLTVERLDPKTKEKHRLVLTMLHSNRYLWRYELCKAEQT